MRKAFAGTRTTQARLQALAAHASGAPAVLLIETKVVFDSVLDTKYRWTVYVKTTLSKSSNPGSPISQQASYPVFLDFDHEREPEALNAAAPQMTEQVARIADDYVGEQRGDR